jgi:hypothetical protein
MCPVRFECPRYSPAHNPVSLWPVLNEAGTFTLQKGTKLSEQDLEFKHDIGFAPEKS